MGQTIQMDKFGRRPLIYSALRDCNAFKIWIGYASSCEILRMASRTTFCWVWVCGIPYS